MRLRNLFYTSWGLALGLACGSGDDGATGDSTGDASSCEHGTMSPCACSDGRMGEQMCKHDGSGFEACVCDGEDGPGTSSAGPEGTTGADDGPVTTDDAASSEGGGGDTTSAAESSGGSDTGPIGAAPEVSILHPGDGEMRVADQPIPFIGEATDAEDGSLAGASLSWSSDVEGPIGQGEMFDAALSTLGDHVITLAATDADGNVTEATITVTIVAP